MIDPEELEGWEFPTVRRGYDPDLVRIVLAGAAEELRRLGGVEGAAVVSADALERAERAEAEVQRLQAEHDRTRLEATDLIERLREQLAAAEVERDLVAVPVVDQLEEEVASLRAQLEGRDAAAPSSTTVAETLELLATVERLQVELADVRSERDRLASEVARRDASTSEILEGDAAGEDGWGHLGKEVAAVLRIADDAAAAMKEAAEVEASDLRRQAEEAAALVQSEADRYAAELTSQTDAWATQRLEAADQDRAAARSELDAARRRAAELDAEARTAAEAAAVAAADRVRAHTEEAVRAFEVQANQVLGTWSDLLRQVETVEHGVREATASMRDIDVAFDPQAVLGALDAGHSVGGLSEVSPT